MVCLLQGECPFWQQALNTDDYGHRELAVQMGFVSIIVSKSVCGQNGLFVTIFVFTKVLVVKWALYPSFLALWFGDHNGMNPYIIEYSGWHISKSFFNADVDECDSSPCKVGSVCVNSEGSYTCECEKGWGGKNCTDGKSRSRLSVFQWLKCSFEQNILFLALVY